MLFPPPAVLAAVGVAGSRPLPLGGGQGMSWLAGDVVVKPADIGPDELAGFRLARPGGLRTATASAVVTALLH